MSIYTKSAEPVRVSTLDKQPRWSNTGIDGLKICLDITRITEADWAGILEREASNDPELLMDLALMTNLNWNLTNDHDEVIPIGSREEMEKAPTRYLSEALVCAYLRIQQEADVPKKLLTNSTPGSAVNLTARPAASSKKSSSPRK